MDEMKQVNEEARALARSLADTRRGEKPMTEGYDPGAVPRGGLCIAHPGIERTLGGLEESAAQAKADRAAILASMEAMRAEMAEQAARLYVRLNSAAKESGEHDKQIAVLKERVHVGTVIASMLAATGVTVAGHVLIHFLTRAHL